MKQREPRSPSQTPHAAHAAMTSPLPDAQGLIAPPDAYPDPLDAAAVKLAHAVLETLRHDPDADLVHIPDSLLRRLHDLRHDDGTERPAVALHPAISLLQPSLPPEAFDPHYQPRSDGQRTVHRVLHRDRPRVLSSELALYTRRPHSPEAPALVACLHAYVWRRSAHFPDAQDLDPSHPHHREVFATTAQKLRHDLHHYARSPLDPHTTRRTKPDAKANLYVNDVSRTEEADAVVHDCLLYSRLTGTTLLDALEREHFVHALLDPASIQDVLDVYRRRARALFPQHMPQSMPPPAASRPDRSPRRRRHR